MPITRARAAKILAELPQRADALNADVRQVYWISRLAVFGSYLGDKPVLGDLDIAMELTARELPIQPARFAQFQADFPPPAYIRHNWFERQFWAQTKLRRDLTPERLVRVHDYGELMLLECPFSVIYERAMALVT